MANPLTELIHNPLIFIAAGALCGGFVNGLAGFGTSLFALVWLLQVLAPVQAVAMTLVLSVLSGVAGLFTVRHHIKAPRLLRFVLPALIGIPIGLAILDHINTPALKTAIGLFLICYGFYFFTRSNFKPIERETIALDSTVGFIGGLLGALAGLSGALPTIWISLKPWGKMDQRSVIQPFNFIVLSISALLLWWYGGYTNFTLSHWAIAIPFTLAGSFSGLWIFKRLSDQTFLLLVVSLTTISGLSILATTLLG